MNICGPNVYVREILPDLGISSTFIIQDLIESREPAARPSEHLEPIPPFEREPIPE